ncbi:MAG: DsrH/TusB family sulfur relay protein [Thermodesulfovibrionales bacterium]|nr:DsrH/TusB family sulfur relay protein [Thermodesulfovibrionales bacterium]
MLVIIKNSPDAVEAKRAVKIARDMAADICLIQNGVYFSLKGRLEGFCGTVYLLDEDRRLRGLSNDDIEKDIKKIDYDDLIELIVNEDNVIGAF